MSKHTKGEWKILNNTYPNHFVIADSEGRGLAKIPLITSEFRIRDEIKANCILMASSPKLLKHLKRMHVCYAKGIQPSVGTLKEIDALLQELK